MRRFRFGAAGILIWACGIAAAQQPATSPMPAAATSVKPAAVVVATVGIDAVTLDRVDAYIRDKLKITLLPDEQLRQLRTEVAEEMVDDLLLKQFLHQQGLKVERAELDRHIAAFTKALALKGKTFAEFLKETNQTEADLRESWTIVLMLNAYVKKTATDEQLKQYYRANKEYFDGVEAKVSHILVRHGKRMIPGEKEAALKKIESVRADIAAKRIDFATAARLHSQCPSAADGGDLGFIPRKGMFDEKFCSAAFALTVDELSQVVETDLGYHLITVTERKPGKPSVFENCIDDVRDSMADDLRRDLIRRMRQQTPVKITIP